MAGSCSSSQCRTPSSLPHSLHGHFLKDSCCQVCGWTMDQWPGDVTCEAQVGAGGGSNNAAINIHVQVFLCTHVSISFGYKSSSEHYSPKWLSSVQFSSVAQSCPTLCDPMNYSMPGLPVHHQLLEFIQTHVHRVSDAIQPSHPLSSPSPPALNPSQHQSLFQ